MSRRNAFRRVMTAFAVVSLLGGGAFASLVETFDPPTATATSGVFGNAPGPAVAGPDAGSTGQFLRLVNDPVGNNFNSYVFDQTDPGLFSGIVTEFDFRLDRPSDPNNPADGFSVMHIPTSTFGTSGLGTYDASYPAEVPNRSGVFGVGFDVYPEGSGVNDISAHWNGTQLVKTNALLDLDQGVFHHAKIDLVHAGIGAFITLTLTPDINGTPGAPVTPISNQFVGTMPSFDSRVEFAGRTGGAFVNADLDNLNVNYLAGPKRLSQDFDGGGTALAPGQFGASPGPATLPGGPTGRFLRLINDGVNNNFNSIAFNQTPDQANTGLVRVVGEFDFRAGGTDASADGFSVVLIPSGTYGTTGPGAFSGKFPGGADAEEPNLADAFGIGFDFHPAATTNDVSVHWDGSELSNITLPLAQIDLEAGVFHHVYLELNEVVGGSLVDLILTPDVFGVPGAPVQPFTSFFVPGLDLYPFRVEFAGRTGGLNMDVDLDNIAFVANTPEPTTLSLLALGGLALIRRRRRRP